MLKFFVFFAALSVVFGARLENIDDSPSGKHEILCDLNSFICKCGDIDVVTCKCIEWFRDCPDNFVYDEESCGCKGGTENVVDHRNLEDNVENQQENYSEIAENPAFQFNDANAETQDKPADDPDSKFPKKDVMNDKIMNRGRKPPELMKSHEKSTTKSIETFTRFLETSINNQKQSQEAHWSIDNSESSKVSTEHLESRSRSSETITGSHEHTSHSGASESIEESSESSASPEYLETSKNSESVENNFASLERLDPFEDNPHPLDHIQWISSSSSDSSRSEHEESMQNKDDAVDTSDNTHTSSIETTPAGNFKSSNEPSSGDFPGDGPSFHLIHPKPSLVSESLGYSFVSSDSLDSSSDLRESGSDLQVSGSDQPKYYGSEESVDETSEPSTESELHSNSKHSRHPMSSHGLIEMPSHYGSHTIRRKHESSPSSEESSFEAVSSYDESSSSFWISVFPKSDNSESSRHHLSSDYASEDDVSSTLASDEDASLLDLDSTSSDLDLTSSDLHKSISGLHWTSSNLIPSELDPTASEVDLVSPDKDLTASELDSSSLDLDSTTPNPNSTSTHYPTQTYTITSTSTSSNESCHIPECRPCDELDQVNCICYQVEMECLPGYTTSADKCECVRDNSTSISDVCPGLICTDGLSVNEAFCNCSHKICSSMEACEDKFLLDLETCECVCGLREWNCQKSFVINKEKCACEPPPCTPFFPCPNGTHWDYDACTCACSNPPKCSSDKYEVDAHSCKCVCANKECDDGFIVDQLTCECVPEHEPECPSKFVYDPMLCRCICQAFNECPYNFQWDESLCKCVCPKSVVCGDDFIWSDQHCDCICNANKTCQANFVFDHKKCDCVCDPKLNDDGCAVGHIFDRRICECVKGVRPQCPAGFVYSEEQCDCVCAVVEKCTGKGIFDHDTCKCVCLEEQIECDFGIFEKEECDCVSGLPIDFFGGNVDED